VVAEVLDALFLQLFKLTWGQSHGKERARGAGHLVAVVAVCTECLCVCARDGLALLNVLGVKGSEVVKHTYSGLIYAMQWLLFTSNVKFM